MFYVRHLPLSWWSTGSLQSGELAGEQLLSDLRPYLDSVTDKAVLEAKLGRTKVRRGASMALLGCAGRQAVTRREGLHHLADTEALVSRLGVADVWLVVLWLVVRVIRCCWARTRPSGTGT